MPLSIFCGKSSKTAFSKMATVGSGRTEMFNLWSYFLEHEFKIAAANNVIQKKM